MTPYGEGQHYPKVTRMMPLLTNRGTTNICTWSVRTTWETGKTHQIAMETRRYNLMVLSISEAHWTQAGQRSLT